MSDNALPSRRGWDHFWVAPTSNATLARTRGLLCLVTIVYFVSAWADVRFWLAGDGVFSPHNTTIFLRTGGLESEAAWSLSPLFWLSDAWGYQVFLIVGIALSLVVFAGRGGRVAGWALWLMLVCWANRVMILSGLTETMLSLGLFAAAIGPPGASWKSVLSRPGVDADEPQAPAEAFHWSSRFATQLIAVQVSLILAATFVTMLGGRVWFNGLGAYALAAPVENRTFDWTFGVLVSPLAHESLTHLMVLAIPLGLALAWLPRTRRIGKAILLLWCLAVALLGSMWLYAAALAAMILTIGSASGGHDTDRVS